EQRANQCPQRASARRLDLDHRRIARIDSGTFTRAVGWREVVVIGLGAEIRNIVAVVVRIVTHEEPCVNPLVKPESRGSITVAIRNYGAHMFCCAFHQSQNSSSAAQRLTCG